MTQAGNDLETIRRRIDLSTVSKGFWILGLLLTALTRGSTETFRYLSDTIDSFIPFTGPIEILLEVLSRCAPLAFAVSIIILMGRRSILSVFVFGPIILFIAARVGLWFGYPDVSPIRIIPTHDFTPGEILSGRGRSWWTLWNDIARFPNWVAGFIKAYGVGISISAVLCGCFSVWLIDRQELGDGKEMT